MEKNSKYTMFINDKCASSGCYEGEDYVSQLNTICLHLSGEEAQTIMPILLRNGLYIEIFDEDKELDPDYYKKH